MKTAFDIEKEDLHRIAIAADTTPTRKSPFLTLVDRGNAACCIGKWFRVLYLKDRNATMRGRIVGLDADNHTLRVADCQLSKIDIDDITVWAENDDSCN